MAIQMRRGQLADYDKNKMLAGEWGITIDSDTERQKAFIAFGPGIDKEVMFFDDAAAQIAEVVESATEEAEAWAHGDKFDTREIFSGDGTTKSFTLAYEPSSVSGVFVDNARTTYTRSGKTITLETAPQSSSNNVRVDYTVNVSTDNAKYYADQMGTISGDVSDLKNDMSDVKNRLNTGLVVTDQGYGVVSISLA